MKSDVSGRFEGKTYKETSNFPQFCHVTVTSILIGNRHVRMELPQLEYGCDNKEREILNQENKGASLRNRLLCSAHISSPINCSISNYSVGLGKY